MYIFIGDKKKGLMTKSNKKQQYWCLEQNTQISEEKQVY